LDTREYELRLKNLSDEILQIQTKYKKVKNESVLKFDSHYQDKIREKREILHFLSNLPNPKIIYTAVQEIDEKIKLKKKELDERNKLLQELRSKEKLLHSESKKKKSTKKVETKQTQYSFSKAFVYSDSSVTTALDIDWKNVHFQDGYIIIKAGNKWFDPFSVYESKKALNHIKAIYKFRNAPKLLIETSGRRITKIENIEVLHYYIKFLSFADTFDSSVLRNKNYSILKFKTYSKSFYKKYLPDLFLPACFDLLCKFSIEDLPIIPVPETVVNSSGNKQIHDSFLFPINNTDGILWIWESIEESKASYIFKSTKEEYETHLQLIFDYLTGDTVNKRFTLIHDKELANVLCFKKRVLHTYQYAWESATRSIIRHGL